MTAPTPTETAQLREWLEPMLYWESSGRETSLERTLGAGLKLPDADALIARALPPAEIAPMLCEAADRIRNTLRPEWVVEPIGERLFGVAECLNGEDALIGAWDRDGRTLQVVATCERLHVLTRLSQTAHPALSDGIGQQAFATACEVLQLPSLLPLDHTAWEVRQLHGHLIVASQRVDAPRTWQETLVLLTDGRGVKLSVRKCYKRAHRPSVGTLFPALIPWFPRPAFDDHLPDDEEDDESGIEDWVEDTQ